MKTTVLVHQKYLAKPLKEWTIIQGLRHKSGLSPTFIHFTLSSINTM